VTGGVGSGSLCWQSHQVRPGQSACLRSRQAWQIMPSTLKSPRRDSRCRWRGDRGRLGRVVL